MGNPTLAPAPLLVMIRNSCCCSKSMQGQPAVMVDDLDGLQLKLQIPCGPPLSGCCRAPTSKTRYTIFIEKSHLNGFSTSTNHSPVNLELVAAQIAISPAEPISIAISEVEGGTTQSTSDVEGLLPGATRSRVNCPRTSAIRSRDY